MATEEGIVTQVASPTMAWVTTDKKSACRGCSARSSCTAMGDEMRVEALNLAGAKQGDRILLSFETASLLKATFLLYLFPILALLAGALIGQHLALHWQVDESASAAAMGFVCFFLAVGIVKIRGNRMARRDSYKPKIVRVLRTTAS